MAKGELLTAEPPPPTPPPSLVAEGLTYEGVVVVEWLLLVLWTEDVSLKLKR